MTFRASRCGTSVWALGYGVLIRRKSPFVPTYSQRKNGRSWGIGPWLLTVTRTGG